MRSAQRSLLLPLTHINALSSAASAPLWQYLQCLDTTQESPRRKRRGPGPVTLTLDSGYRCVSYVPAYAATYVLARCGGAVHPLVPSSILATLAVTNVPPFQLADWDLAQSGRADKVGSRSTSL